MRRRGRGEGLHDFIWEESLSKTFVLDLLTRTKSRHPTNYAHRLPEEEGEVEGQGDEPVVVAEAAPPATERYELETHPWYKPSYPVLLALAPPDALLRLFLIFYLDQLIEGPALAALPRRAPRPHSTRSSCCAHEHPARARLFCLLPFTLFVCFFGAGRLARLEAQVAAKAGALTAYVDDALAPVEKVVRRAERRVDNLRARQGVPLLKIVPHLKTTAGAEAGAGETGRGKGTHTVLVPAPSKQPGLLAGGGMASASPTKCLELILEEREGEHAAFMQSAYPSPAPPPLLVHVPTPQLLLVLPRRCVALWPLRALVQPVCFVLGGAR
ncbi:hypothetical protein FB451DRAFT_1407888 [Mycena latifolia]|nr:hypothetical protein FB451DRAFT_1407888 [Mycena latifolia]